MFARDMNFQGLDLNYTYKQRGQSVKQGSSYGGVKITITQGLKQKKQGLFGVILELEWTTGLFT